MNQARLPFALLAPLVLAACGLADRDVLAPEGQLLIHVDTDAWLARAPGELARDDDPPALFHTLRVELFAPGEDTACPGCTREFALDRVAVSHGRASLGFVPRVGVSGYRARVRLYRNGGAGEGKSEPRRESTIDRVVRLPATRAEGVTDVTVFLATDDVGRPQGTLDAPLEPQPGRPGPSRVGSWNAQVLGGCESEPREGEVCIAGSAFWMGDPQYTDQIPERLVALSPFVIDATEVTVAEMRASGVAEGADPTHFSATKNPYCTYASDPGDGEDRPVNCVSPRVAERYCEARGGTLMSEAQYEYVAGALRGWTFPWGNNLADCDDAVFARVDEAVDRPELEVCRVRGVGVSKVGTGRLDRVKVGAREIVDLAGNLREWTRDAFAATSGPCWASPALDPVCNEPLQDGLLALRGGSWRSFGSYELAAAVRHSAKGEDKTQYAEVGIRCARAIKR